MTDRPDIPDEIQNALRELHREGRASYHGLMDGGLRELYPLIRKQGAEEERERVFKALRSLPEFLPDRSFFQKLIAALDSTD